MRISIVLALLCLAMPARADDVEEAKKYYQLGTMNYDLEQYQAALESFERARQLKPLPGFLFNIAQCHRRLGHHDEAIRFFEQYLTEAPAAKNAAEVKGLIADARKAQSTAPLPVAKSDAAAEPEPLVPESAPSATPSEGDDQTILWAAVGGGALLVAAGAAVLIAVLPAPSPASLGRIDLRTAAP